MKYSTLVVLLALSPSGYGQVSLSEMQSSNNTTIVDSWGEYDDWIEIHNPTSDTIEVGGLILKDQLDTWAIPTGDPATLLLPGAYFFLWADDQEIQGIFHTNFKLASGGEFLGLYESDGVTIIDSVSIPALNADDSYIRCNTTWIQSNAPTPSAANDCTVGVNEVVLAERYNISTNSSGELVIDAFEQLQGQEKLQIHALDGKRVLESALQEKKTIVDLPALEGGIYIVSITSASSSYSKRIWLGK